MVAPIAVILGAGPGTGAAIARALGKTHSLVLLSRSLPGSLAKLELNLPDDRVLAHTFDASSAAQSFSSALESAEKKWPGAKFNVGVINLSTNFAPGPFLERKVDDLKANLAPTEQAFEFSQAIIPRMLPSGGTLLFTGATMAMRAGANFSAMAPGSFSRRALAQSLAREFGPKNIHVCHVIVDGIIDTQRVHGMMGAGEEGTRILPDDIAQVYVDIINQPKSVWTQELDIRPSKETW